MIILIQAFAGFAWITEAGPLFTHASNKNGLGPRDTERKDVYQPQIAKSRF